jgi:Flp pilus assembly protein CpaB
MANGKKQVHYIPGDWVEIVRLRVESGRQFREAVAELLVANARLLALERKQRR